MSKLDTCYKICQKILQMFNRNIIMSEAMSSKVLKFNFARTHFHIIPLHY